MRVLSVQHYPTFGGPYNEILRLNSALLKRDVETIAVMTNEPGSAYPRLRGRVPVYRIPLARLRLSKNPRLHFSTATSFRRDISLLRGVMRRTQPDLVKVHGPHNPHGAFAAHLERIPVVWVISSTRVPAPLRKTGIRLVDRYASAVLVTGQGLLREYPGSQNIMERVFPYYAPVDLDVFYPRHNGERIQIRRELGVPANASLVGMIANINPQKGITTFVRAAHKIIQQVPDAYFAIAGAISESQQEYYQRARNEATTLGLDPDRFMWLGERSDVPNLLASFDIKVISSVPESEGTPTTAGEAMACGVPVVATNVGAVDELIEDGTSGLLVEPNDEQALANQIVLLLHDDQRRQRMGLAARKRMVEHFGVERCADTHIAAYTYALEGKPSTPSHNSYRP